MSNIHSSQNGDPANEPASLHGVQETIQAQLHEINIADGGEFLDDGIRMKDQPLEETAEKKKE